MATDPLEDPPIKPGQPTEPPLESPPGNPQQPDVPPPMREPGAPPRPEELPGRTPEELPVRGPGGPTTPNPAIADLQLLQPDVNPGISDLPQGTM